MKFLPAIPEGQRLGTDNLENLSARSSLALLTSICVTLGDLFDTFELSFPPL